MASPYSDEELARMDAVAERREAAAAYRAAHPEDTLPLGKCCGVTRISLLPGFSFCPLCGSSFDHYRDTPTP